MNVTVVGSGNGGLATAFDFAFHGHDVRLFDTPHFPDHVGAVSAAGGIHATGELEGFADDRLRRLRGRDRSRREPSWSCWSGRRTARRIRPGAVAPHLAPGQAVLICPASCAGAITFKRTAGLALDDESITVGETSTLPYAARIVAPGRVNIFHKLSGGVFVAGLPRSGTERLMSMIQDVYPGTEAAESVFQTTLQNGNPVIHPAVTLLNAGAHRADRRRFPVLRGGGHRVGGPGDRGGGPRAAGHRRGAGGTRPLRSRTRDGAGLHARGQLLHRILHRSRLPRDQRAEPARQPLPDRGCRLLAGLPGRPGRAGSASRLR